jgi:hypothetical protein
MALSNAERQKAWRDRRNALAKNAEQRQNSGEPDTDVMVVPHRISFLDLMETARSFPPEVRADPNRLTFTMAVTIVRHFFGKQWCEDNIIQDADRSRPDGFMRIDFTPGFQGERKTARILDFAEMLFNLQHIEGFDGRVDQMRAGQVEATFAEFDFARFLYIHDVAFKFVKPVGAKGKDYDVGIEYSDGREACADAKCRLEDTEVRADTIRNSLAKARTNNLPPDKPGVIFVKVPQTWFEQADVRTGIRAVGEEFLRSTKRIVSVVVYTTAAVKMVEQKMTLLRHRFLEFLNPAHRFDRTKSWAVFKDFEVPEEWGGVHADSGRSRPRFRDDVARRSGMKPPTIPR